MDKQLETRTKNSPKGLFCRIPSLLKAPSVRLPPFRQNNSRNRLQSKSETN